jgi:hypothetical protein
MNPRGCVGWLTDLLGQDDLVVQAFLDVKCCRARAECYAKPLSVGKYGVQSVDGTTTANSHPSAWWR